MVSYFSCEVIENNTFFIDTISRYFCNRK